MKEATFVWAVAVFGPITTKELEKLTDGPNENVSHVATRCWRRRYVVRREVESSKQKGRPTYEYRLNTDMPA